MAKPEWGNKRICQSCSAPFYDLRRSPIICPKCGATFDPEAILKSRRPGAPKDEPAEKPEKKKLEPEKILADDDSADEDDILADDDDGDDDVLEDASDLGDDDVAAVVNPKDDKEDT